MLYKYLIENKFYIKMKTKKITENRNIFYDKTMPFFDSYEEAYERILREKKDIIDNNKDDLLNGDTPESLKSLMINDFIINFETKTINSGLQKYTIYKTKEGITTEVKSKNLEMKNEYVIKKILKSNLIYAITESFTDNNYNFIKLYSKFYTKLEEASVDASNMNYAYPNRFSQLSYFDKSKIYKDENIINLVVDAYFNGYINDENTFDFFDTKIIQEKIFNKKYLIREKIEENKKLEEKYEKEKKEMQKTIDKLSDTLEKLKDKKTHD